MLLAHNCIYACKNPNQNPNILILLGCLPDRGYGPQSPAMEKLHDSIDELEVYYNAVEVLQKYHVTITIDKLKQLSNRSEEKEVDEFLTSLCRSAGKMYAYLILLSHLLFGISMLCLSVSVSVVQIGFIYLDELFICLNTGGWRTIVSCGHRTV